MMEIKLMTYCMTAINFQCRKEKDNVTFMQFLSYRNGKIKIYCHNT